MRLSLTLIIASFLFIIWGCKNSNEKGPSSSETPETPETTLQLPDTLVHSFPVNYSLTLDALNDSSKVEIGSYKDVLDLFEKLNYTPESWQAGIREIPRVYLTTIGERWGSSTTKEITVLNKKQLFFRGIAPLILRSNELIKKDRDRLEGIRSSFQNTDSLSKADQTWILKLSGLYKVKVPEGQLTATELEELWKKVDIIPPSLALAQGAEESGWGTSRFALAGNAIYGQWTWGKDAIVPEEQRKELGNYGIASFESLQQSISAYMLNLNTHNAYSDLRTRRATLRKNGEKVTGVILAEGLLRYSERGEVYVESLKSMMAYNKLSPVDDAYLSDEHPLYLFPLSLETP
jgi:Bax protein